MLQKSGCGGSISDSTVMAGDAGLVQLLGGLVADPGVSGVAPAGPGLDVVHSVPQVYIEDLGVQVDVLVVGPLVLGWRFLRL